MKHRATLLLLCAPLFSGCFQELDTGAALEGPAPSAGGSVFVDSGLIYANDAGLCPPGMITGGSDGVSRYGVCIPQDNNTAVIQLVKDDDTDPNASTTDACKAIEFQSMQVRTMNCGPCHGGGPGQHLGQFSTVLNDSPGGGLINADVPSLTIDTATGKPEKLVIPGNPDKSRVYQRIAGGLKENNGDGMPPPGVTPRPNISDVSIIRSWIFCLGGGTPSGPAAGSSTSSGSSGGTDAGASSSPSSPSTGDAGAGTAPARDAGAGG